MRSETAPRVVCMTNVYDSTYCALRGGEIKECLFYMKRAALFACLGEATGREVILLSSPPRAAVPLHSRWLAPVETRFSGFRQFFCGNWDVPKIRIPFSWVSYAWNALRLARAGDIIVVDNFELLYVLAARLVNLFRPVTFLLDYEDGKHLIDQRWDRLVSGTAEWLGKPLIRAAFLAHPNMRERLPARVITEVVPGFISTAPARTPPPSPPMRFLYSGSLDATRGVDLLMAALPLLPADGWHLEISGAGPLSAEVAAFAADPRWREKVTFHGILPTTEYEALMAVCHVGLNCQRGTDAISSVTFPSKTFTYLSTGLIVLSSRASSVELVCGAACVYYDAETPAALAAAMTALLENRSRPDAAALARMREHYTIAGTTERVKQALHGIGLV